MCWKRHKLKSRLKFHKEILAPLVCLEISLLRDIFTGLLRPGLASADHNVCCLGFATCQMLKQCIDYLEITVWGYPLVSRRTCNEGISFVWEQVGGKTTDHREGKTWIGSKPLGIKMGTGLELTVCRWLSADWQQRRVKPQAKLGREEGKIKFGTSTTLPHAMGGTELHNFLVLDGAHIWI